MLRSYNAQRCAKLTVSTEKGKLKVILVENFNKHTESVPLSKGPRKISPSQLRRKARRAADPAVKDRAAVHAAGQEAAAREEILPSPEKLGSNTSLESLSGPDFFQRPLKIIISCGGVRSPNPLRSVGWGT